MKNTNKFFGIIVLIAIIGFTMAACSRTLSNDDNNVGENSDSILEAFDNWLSNQPSNTPDTAYTVKRNFINYSYSWDSGKYGRGIRDILSDNPTKYVNLDLSGSKGGESLSFWHCTSLTGIILNNPTYIGWHDFEGCTNLASITIPDSVTGIGEGAFGGCTSLTGIILPDSITSIGKHAFEGCTSLTGITIPNRVTSIEYCVFKGCTSLTSITIPDNITDIQNWAFELCSNLTSVTFQGAITSDNFYYRGSFPGDLRDKYLASDGGIGTYTRENDSGTWTKQ